MILLNLGRERDKRQAILQIVTHHAADDELVQSIVHQRLASINTMVNTIVGSSKILYVVQMFEEFNTSEVDRWTNLTN
jgi:hypothetical protein